MSTSNKVTTVLKIEGGDTKIREGAFGLTITGFYQGVHALCYTEYGIRKDNEARILVVVLLHWLNDLFPKMITKAIATFLIESGIADKNAEGIYLKFKEEK